MIDLSKRPKLGQDNVLELTSSILGPHLKNIESLDGDEQRDATIALAMALGLSMAFLGDRYFSARESPEEYGAEMGRFIGGSVRHAKEAINAEDESEDDGKRSSWN